MIRLALAIAALALAAGAIVAPPAAQIDTSAKGVLAAALTYVERYQSDFKFLVADESYLQRMHRAGGGSTLERHIAGELFLTYLAVDKTWIAVHDFARVDGRPVPDREDLARLLQKGEVTNVAKRVADRNATFNIGHIQRNFNEPTLPLLLLTAGRARGLDVDRRAVSGSGGETKVTLAFTERERPTLVRGRTGQLFGKGELVIDASTGRVERTTLQFKDGDIVARLSTEYAPDDRLKLWVPSVFTEHYEGNPSGGREVIDCEAQYTNYRRFDVTGRIK